MQPKPKLPLDDEIPERLPLVDAVVERWAPDRDVLTDAVALLIQHQLGSIVPMTRALTELGLDPESLYWVDIPYTANPKVVEHLRAIGIPADNFAASDYHLDQPFLRYQLRRVAQLIPLLRKKVASGRPLLVLDDGAYFLEAVSYFKEPPSGIRMVEQTRRGMLKLRASSAMQRCAARVPLINVAESPPKTDIEAGFIATTICDALVSALHRQGVAAGGRETLLLGYGAMGAAIADVLVHDLRWPKSRIRVLDTDADAQERATAAGLASWTREDTSRRFGLVIGCTGTTSLGVGDWVHLDDGAILASASSGSSELAREQFIEMADVHEEDDVFLEDRKSLQERSIHDAIEVHVVDRTVVFLNGGFPINFTGGVNSTPPELIQLTRALMLGGAIQAMSADEPGLVDLDPSFCAWITEQFRDQT